MGSSRIRPSLRDQPDGSPQAIFAEQHHAPGAGGGRQMRHAGIIADERARYPRDRCNL